MSFMSKWWHKRFLRKRDTTISKKESRFSPLKKQLGATAKVARIIKGDQAGLVQLASNGELYEAKAKPQQVLPKQTIVQVVGYEGWHTLLVCPLS